MLTTCTQPRDNTPLMLMAKAQFKAVSDTDYVTMISQLVRYGGDINAVDDRGMNAFMHAVGCANTIFVEHVCDRADHYRDVHNFNFNARNKDFRNA